ncbi:hypothetical protein GM30_14975 [Trabulsiella odontotermitis]|nr:hypothetical protein GM30_14975 [Trabulsiella odontotermitis]
MPGGHQNCILINCAVGKNLIDDLRGDNITFVLYIPMFCRREYLGDVQGKQYDKIIFIKDK